MKEKELAIFWFRRDLRLHDNAALYHALRSGLPVIPVFIFDTNILDELEDRDDARVDFIHRVVNAIFDALKKYGVGMEVLIGKPDAIFKKLIGKYPIKKVYTNHDYEPYAIDRDSKIEKLLIENGISFHTAKDQVIFEKDEILKDNGQPYTVFTPYSRKWLAKLNAFYLKPYPTEKYWDGWFKQDGPAMPTLEKVGFTASSIPIPSVSVNKNIIADYDKTRNFPGIEGTTRMGIHLRFGTVSVRELARIANGVNATYLNELIWRDFFQMILWHFPHVGQGKAFKPAYDHIKWRYNEIEFKQWCNGMTGYPMVDAGMRELNATGFMHNRVRMVTASFLSKHLLIDWRWGEAYFARKLLDYELSSNNGNWQWAAGCGCDAAPYFRIFNPTTQAQKFDKDHNYINTWIPELNDFAYPTPIVEHEAARKRCLEAYSKAVKEFS
ncbi:deoxyribodipyrimidine photo-lyase [Pollutibacter soli]|uniref:cryptochrome/photolyase family protein n=1 Tax=Pollutibacter soli TaxID=3034157 RepID=UPI003013518E